MMASRHLEAAGPDGFDLGEDVVEVVE